MKLLPSKTCAAIQFRVIKLIMDKNIKPSAKKVLSKIPLIGRLFGGGEDGEGSSIGGIISGAFSGVKSIITAPFSMAKNVLKKKTLIGILSHF